MEIVAFLGRRKNGRLCVPLAPDGMHTLQVSRAEEKQGCHCVNIPLLSLTCLAGLQVSAVFLIKSSDPVWPEMIRDKKNDECWEQ